MNMKHVARDVHVPVFLAGLGEGWPSLTDADRTLPGRGCGQNTHEQGLLNRSTALSVYL